MEITLEQVEKLRARSNLSYEEARKLLEQWNGSVLDALIDLERRGRVGGGDGGAWTGTDPGQEPPIYTPVPVDTVTGSTWENFWKDAKSLFGRCWEVVRHCNLYQLQIMREGKTMTEMPMWVLLVMLLVAPWVAVPLLVAGLILGCQYRIKKEA